MRLFVAPLAVALLLSGAIDASASTLSKELLSPQQLPSWSHFSVSAAELTGCPGSSFQSTTSSDAVRVFLVERHSQTLFAERLVTSSDPAATFASAVATVATCHGATRINDNATAERIKALPLGSFPVPVRAFSLYAVVAGMNVTGYLAYASKRGVLLEVGEISIGSISARAFRADVNLALAQIRA